MMQRPEFHTYWDNIYGRRPSRHYFPNPFLFRNDDELDVLFRRLLSPDNTKRLLEVGAGGSIWLPYFARRFHFHVYGIDFSKNGCEAARRNLSSSGERGEIVCADFFGVGPEWDDFFDVVFSNGFIEHFEDPKITLTLMKKVLKPGGLLITVIPNTRGLVFNLERHIDKGVHAMHKALSMDDLVLCHEELRMPIVQKQYMRFLDMGILNFDRVLGKGSKKVLELALSVFDLPFLYLQKLLRFYPQSKKLCSAMFVVGKKLQNETS